MDYVVGSVAALITGNVTPSRPRLMKRALTPTKHQPSPNVTPKSEFVEDRSIFLSPSIQKKKAIVKKSPKRIFQNPELENTEDGDGNISLSSPKADKVKKHLKDDLDADCTANTSTLSQKTPKIKGNKRESISTLESDKIETEQNVNESTPKKKKKKQNSESEVTEEKNPVSVSNVSTEEASSPNKSPKKRKQKNKSIPLTDCKNENKFEIVNEVETPSSNEKSPKKQKNKLNNSQTTETSNEITTTGNSLTPIKKNKKRKKKTKLQSDSTAENIEKTDNVSELSEENLVKENQVIQKKKNKKRNKNKSQKNKPEIMETDKPTSIEKDESSDENIENNKINPNAITDKESDSEHESDDEIESENEEINKKVLELEKPESSDDEDGDEQKVNNKVEKKEVEKKEAGGVEKYTEEEIKRTLFVGNVPFSAKCKKEIKKIFNKHGQIETIRIRTVPLKDGRYTPKLAVIKNELHPERTTVNVYIKYVDADSVEKALSENNTILNEHHLRVSRSSSTGAEHDPRCSVFIGNLPFAMEDEALRAKFEKCGEINSVRIIRDKKTNAGKGFGYVNFESKDGVELALALTEEDLTVKNRILRVKRCTQVTNKKKPAPTGHYQGNKKNASRPGNQQANRNGGFREQRSGYQSNQQGGGFRSGGNKDNQVRGFRSGGNQGNQDRGFRSGGNQGNQDRGFRSGGNQGNQDRGFRSGGYQGNQDRGGFKKFGNQRNDRGGQKNEEGGEGAFRRIMNKRKFQEGTSGGDEPVNKRQKNVNQPQKEKKSRKEFVGMTAEKKKKHKFDKGQKKKKALSEILTK